jgi:RNA polymerase sigma-70 factor (ECF subfamily)
MEPEHAEYPLSLTMVDTTTADQESQKSVSDRDFEKIVAENESRIFNTVYSFTGNYEDALDLTQETFIHAYRNIGRFRHESSIYTWLYRIAINLCKRAYSKKRRRGSILTGSLDDPETLQQIARQASEEKSAIEIMELGEEQLVIRREIAALPDKHKAVIILKYLQELSYEEIAEVLGCGIGTVKSRLSRAKEKLKKRLEEAIEVSHDGL